MPDRETYQYAVLRVVPLIERAEFLNCGVVLYCRRHRFLSAKIHLDTERLRALFPDADAAEALRQLEIRGKIADGDPSGGPIALQSQSERFGWMVSPSSTVIQCSPVHTGMCESPELALQRLFGRLVLINRDT